MPLFLLTMSYLEAVFLSTLGPNHPRKSIIRLLYIQRSQAEACVVGHHSPKGESPITAIWPKPTPLLVFVSSSHPEGHTFAIEVVVDFAAGDRGKVSTLGLTVTFSLTPGFLHCESAEAVIKPFLPLGWASICARLASAPGPWTYLSMDLTIYVQNIQIFIYSIFKYIFEPGSDKVQNYLPLWIIFGDLDPFVISLWISLFWGSPAICNLRCFLFSNGFLTLADFCSANKFHSLLTLLLIGASTIRCEERTAPVPIWLPH